MMHTMEDLQKAVDVAKSLWYGDRCDKVITALIRQAAAQARPEPKPCQYCGEHHPDEPDCWFVT